MKKLVFIISLAIILTACAPAQPTIDTQSTALAIVQTGIALTQTARPTFTPTATVVYPTPSPLPTQPPFPVITPDAIQVERWREYQAELAKTIMEKEASVGQVLCEWEILGRATPGKEVYVWALCTTSFPIGDTINPMYPMASIPAVIRLNEDNSIENVEIPGAGSDYARDIRRMFPLSAQERIFDHLVDYQKLMEHLEWRRIHKEEPPWIVFSVTPMP